MANIFKIAENLLNNLDQSAQTALNKTPTDNEKNKQRNLKVKTLNEFNSRSSTPVVSLSTSSSIGNLFQNPSSSSLNMLDHSSARNSVRLNVNKEDELIEFLNSSQPTELPQKKKELRMNSDNMDHPENFPNDKVEFTIGDKLNTSNRQSDTEEDHCVSSEETCHLKKNVAGSAKDEEENKILRNEIVSLNSEVKSLLKRIKQTEEEYNKGKRKLDQYQSQISESDKIIRELRAREEDMSESLRNKDSQLAILRIRFEESDNELKSKRKEIETIRLESERILKDHTNSSDIQSQAFETLKEKLNELEIQLQREKSSFSEAQREHMAIQSKLENEKHTINETLQTLEKKINDEKIKNSEINAQIKNSKTAYNHLKQELEEYKLKATRTLQTKDRLIASLKEVSSNDPSRQDAGNGDGSLNSIRLIELEELKSEKDHLKEELSSKITSLEMIRFEMMELESQSTIEIEALKDQLSNLMDQIDEQKQSKECLELDLKNIRQQLDFAHDELYKQKSMLNNKLQERETEIERLRNQLTTKSLGTTTEKELENRLHLLTENLIQKQTLIEALQSEKHSIFLQLERSEKRLQDYENIVSSKKTSISIRMSDDDEKFSETSKIPYLRESPYDHEVTKKVKRAATEIDKFSIRLGVFLKKYPIARIFVIFYMVLLHLWVMIVLFTYKPEAHDADYAAHLIHPQEPK